MFGRLKLAQVLEPAIAAAEAGIPVDWGLRLTILDRIATIRRLPATAQWLLREGLPPSSSDRLDGTDLARTLRRIAAQGKRGFYEGPVAEAIERTVVGAGGIPSSPSAPPAAINVTLIERRGQSAGEVHQRF